MTMYTLGWTLLIIDSIMVYLICLFEAVNNAPVAPGNDEGNLP